MLSKHSKVKYTAVNLNNLISNHQTFDANKDLKKKKNQAIPCLNHVCLEPLYFSTLFAMLL